VEADPSRRRAGPYRLDRKLGEAGWLVCLATDSRLSRRGPSVSRSHARTAGPVPLMREAHSATHSPMPISPRSTISAGR
jgi:hypothetical protein